MEHWNVLKPYRWTPPPHPPPSTAPGFACGLGIGFPSSKIRRKPGGKAGAFWRQRTRFGFLSSRMPILPTVENEHNSPRGKKDGKRRGNEKAPGSEGKNRGHGGRISEKKQAAAGRIWALDPFLLDLTGVVTGVGPARGGFWISFVRCSFAGSMVVNGLSMVVNDQNQSQLIKAGKCLVSRWNTGTF